MPNKLTLLRVAIAPVFLIFLLWESLPHNFMIANVIFIIASITDLIDGKLARKHGLITDFGKFLDPLADKVLVLCALVGLVELNIISAWFCVIILTREFLVTSLRLVAVTGGEVIPASKWGKAKTITQITAIITILTLQEVLYILSLPELIPATKGFLPIAGSIVDVMIPCMMIVVTVLTIISGIMYIVSHKSYIDVTK